MNTNKQPSPDTLAKAIEETENCLKHNPHTTVSGEYLLIFLTVAKQVQELQEQLCREQEKLKIENEPTVRANIAYLVSQVNKLEQSSREKDELIEKLVELLENGQEKFKLDFAARHKMPCFVTPLDEALQLAHSKGYGKKG